MKYLRIASFLLIFCFLSTISAQEDTPSDNIPANRAQITPENAGDLTPLFSIQTPLNGISSIVFSPDMRYVFFGGPGGILVMPMDDPESFASIERNPYMLQGGIAFSPDGTMLATANVDHIRLWDMATGTMIGFLETDYPPGTMQFSPDGTVLAVGADGLSPDTQVEPNQVYLWDVGTGEQYGAVGYPYSWLGRQGGVAFRFSPDGESLWSVIGPYVHAWDYRQPQSARDPLLRTWEEYLARLMSFRYTPLESDVYGWTAFANAEGDYALWITDDNGASHFVTQAGDVQTVINGESGVDFAEDGIPNSFDEYTRLGRAELAQSLSTLEATSFNYGDVALRLVNRREAAASIPRFDYNETTGTLVDEMSGEVYFLEDNGIAGRFETISGEPLPTLSAYYSVGDVPAAQKVVVLETNQFNFSNDGTILAQVDTDENGQAFVGFTNLQTDAVSRFALESTQIDGLIFNPAADIALIDYDRRHYVVDVATGELLRQLEPTGNAIFSPDGTLILTQFFGEFTFWGVVSE